MDPKVVIDGKEYPLVTADQFTLGEAADAEQITGQDYDMEKGGAAGLLAMTYVSVRRVRGDVTVDDIRELTGSRIDVLVEEGKVLPPTNSADSSSTVGGNEPSMKNDSEADSDDSPEDPPEPTGAPV